MKIRALISVACAALASGAPLVWHAGPLRQPSVPFAMDIHLPVLGAAADAARAANAVLNAGLNSTAIDFANGAHTPHITLYRITILLQDFAAVYHEPCGLSLPASIKHQFVP